MLNNNQSIESSNEQKKGEYVITHEQFQKIRMEIDENSTNILNDSKIMLKRSILVLSILSFIAIPLIFFVHDLMEWWHYLIFIAGFLIWTIILINSLTCKKKYICNEMFVTDNHLLISGSSGFYNIPLKIIKNISQKSHSTLNYKHIMIKIELDDSNEITFKSNHKSEVIDKYFKDYNFLVLYE